MMSNYLFLAFLIDKTVYVCKNPHEKLLQRALIQYRNPANYDLVREALVESRSTLPGVVVMGTLTIIYDHHSNDLQEKLHTIQHDYFDTIISTMHVHVDEHMCLEVIVMRGETGLVQSVANLILGTKGVKNGKLVLTTTGRHL